MGNTTKALTKGYGIGSAALAAFLLFRAYLDVIKPVNPSQTRQHGEPAVFIAGLIGAMLIFLFSSLAIRAVGSAAQEMIRKCAASSRRTRDHGGDRGARLRALRGHQRSLGAASDGVARHPRRRTPIIVGMLLGPEAAAGLLMVGTIVGIMMALS